ncbi:hypothetical protein Pelo_18140 [Pelomyxa schiedti]|nr:hypothetical protein Pelo_18140 [Pelomyxa schiedti]
MTKRPRTRHSTATTKKDTENTTPWWLGKVAMSDRGLRARDQVAALALASQSQRCGGSSPAGIMGLHLVWMFWCDWVLARSRFSEVSATVVNRNYLHEYIHSDDYDYGDYDKAEVIIRTGVSCLLLGITGVQNLRLFGRIRQHHGECSAHSRQWHVEHIGDSLCVTGAYANKARRRDVTLPLDGLNVESITLSGVTLAQAVLKDIRSPKSSSGEHNKVHIAATPQPPPRRGIFHDEEDERLDVWDCNHITAPQISIGGVAPDPEEIESLQVIEPSSGLVVDFTSLRDLKIRCSEL